MSPILADAIDIPFVFGLGLAVLIPLMAFEIFAEAFILRSVWRLPFGHLCRFTLFANLWSLIAGIPTKILNSWLYSFLLPEDLPGFFARYSVAVGIGTLVYFGITIAIEGVYAFRWLRRNQHAIARSAVWKGILAANLATYAVLAPLHYFATRPMHQVHEFTQNTLWTKHCRWQKRYRIRPSRGRGSSERELSDPVTGDPLAREPNGCSPAASSQRGLHRRSSPRYSIRKWQQSRLQAARRS
jgi:hypothetical protein